MSKIAIIAWREFTQTVLRKIFLLAIIGIPVLIVGAIVLMVVVMAGHEEPPLEGTIAVVDPTGEVIEAARREFDPTRIEADRQQERDQIQQATQDILSGGATSGAIPDVPQPLCSAAITPSVAVPWSRLPCVVGSPGGPIWLTLGRSWWKS